MGAGGVGSYMGALLARAGAEVTLICRGAHLAAIRADGLRVTTPDGEVAATDIAATDNPAAVGPVDVVVQSVKLYDLAASSQQLRPMIGPETTLVPVQNGVTAPEEIGAIVGSTHVVGGVVFINSTVVAPGVVHCKSDMNSLIFGELDGRASQRVAAFREVCLSAGIDARVSDSVQTEQWRKFVPVAGLSAISCLSRQPIGPIREDRKLRALYRQAMTEVVALATAKGVVLESNIVEHMLAAAQRYQPDARVSMLEDLEAGKPLELDWLSGYVSREARQLGVATPFHDVAYACLKPLAAGRRGSG
ncbi:MAG TPA: 2-dehydropantoate 2-reductase [Burkholderiales bacterium]|nr:2-dehydropantoate 2-reductase [Burkholderiales bacterium]